MDIHFLFSFSFSIFLFCLFFNAALSATRNILSKKFQQSRRFIRSSLSIFLAKSLTLLCRTKKAPNLRWIVQSTGNTHDYTYFILFSGSFTDRYSHCLKFIRYSRFADSIFSSFPFLSLIFLTKSKRFFNRLKFFSISHGQLADWLFFYISALKFFLFPCYSMVQWIGWFRCNDLAVKIKRFESGASGTKLM